MRPPTKNPGRTIALRAECPDPKLRRRLLAVISGAILRCHSPRAPHYADYGGRGIHVCPEWRGNRPLFLRHLMTLDGHDQPGLRIDRIDNDRGYEPGNLRFVTCSVSSANQRRRYGNAGRGGSGVTFVRRLNKWQAQLSVENINQYLGLYATREEAVAVVNAKREELESIATWGADR